MATRWNSPKLAVVMGKSPGKSGTRASVTQDCCARSIRSSASHSIWVRRLAGRAAPAARSSYAAATSGSDRNRVLARFAWDSGDHH
jgi:hypothetical protein